MAQGKNLIGLMVREGLISFVHVDRTVFVKTAAEKLKVQQIKNAHDRAVKKLGANPKRIFNPKGMTL